MKHSLIFLSLFLSAQVFSQITINQNDMPDAGNWYIKSTTLNFSFMDFTKTGPDTYWDYSGLSEMGQSVDTFIKVSETPVTYQFIFASILDPNKATMASPTAMVDTFLGFLPGNSLGFYRVEASEYSYLGFGADFMGTPVPIKYSDPEEIFELPLSYGKKGTVTSFFETPVFFSSFFYYASEKNTSYHVDGWGKLKTPYGEFDALRVKSVSNTVDTFYIDSLSMGYEITRPTEVKYEWLSKNTGIPLLTATAQVAFGDTIVSQLNYQDSLRNGNPNNTPDLSGFTRTSVYPNPTTRLLFIEITPYEAGDLIYTLYDLNGKQLISGNQKVSHIRHILFLDLQGLKFGEYILNLQLNGRSWSTKVIKDQR